MQKTNTKNESFFGGFNFYSYLCKLIIENYEKQVRFIMSYILFVSVAQQYRSTNMEFGDRLFSNNLIHVDFE